MDFMHQDGNDEDPNKEQKEHVAHGGDKLMETTKQQEDPIQPRKASSSNEFKKYDYHKNKPMRVLKQEKLNRMQTENGTDKEANDMEDYHREAEEQPQNELHVNPQHERQSQTHNILIPPTMPMQSNHHSQS